MRFSGRQTNVLTSEKCTKYLDDLIEKLPFYRQDNAGVFGRFSNQFGGQNNRSNR
jgi:hypothetical protein